MKKAENEATDLMKNRREVTKEKRVAKAEKDQASRYKVCQWALSLFIEMNDFRAFAMNWLPQSLGSIWPKSIHWSRLASMLMMRSRIFKTRWLVWMSVRLNLTSI